MTVTVHRKLSFVLLSFRGRIGRAQWWWGTLTLFLTAEVMTAFVGGFGDASLTAKIGSLIYLGLFRLVYAVCAKRFQDRGKAGARALWGMIPWTISVLLGLYKIIDLEAPSTFTHICAGARLVVAIWFIVELGCLPGTPTPNRFDAADQEGAGENPGVHAVIGGRLLALFAAVGAVILMACVYNTFAWLGSFLVSIPVFLLEGASEFTDNHYSAVSFLTLTIAATYGATAAFVLSTPCVRFALRALPVDPFHRRSAYTLAVLGLGVLALMVAIIAFGMTCVSFVNVTSRAIHSRVYADFVSEHDAYELRERLPQEAIVRLGWSSVALGGLAMFVGAHARGARSVGSPFVLFLRRFSGFADRALIVNLLKAVPPMIPMAFIASRSDKARNWDPLVWSFGGLRILRPFRNLPLQIRTSDLHWKETVWKLLRRARCVVLDISDSSAAVAIERALVLKYVPLDRVIVLADTRQGQAPLEDVLARRAIRYTPSYKNGLVWLLTKLSLYLWVWWLNRSTVWAWFLLLLVPFVFVPAISRDEKRRIREAIAAALQTTTCAPEVQPEECGDQLPPEALHTELGREPTTIPDPEHEDAPTDDDVVETLEPSSRWAQTPPSDGKSQGPCFWLTIFATLTAGMLFAASSGINLPNFLIYAFNPIAWAFNVLSASVWAHDFLVAVEAQQHKFGTLIGWPIFSSFVAWFMVGWIPWRRPGVAFLFLILPAFGAMQLATRRAYVAIADKFHDQGKFGLEADALSKALYITHKMGSTEGASLEWQTRLDKLVQRSSEAPVPSPAEGK